MQLADRKTKNKCFVRIKCNARPSIIHGTGTEAMATGTISSSSSLSCISSTQPQQTDTINDDMNDDLSSQSMNSYSTSGRPNPMMAIKDVTPILASKNGSNITTKKSSMNVLKKLNSADNGKHDTRIVNEAFQDAVSMLENGFGSKMQAEMLVLVDVLHKPLLFFLKTHLFVSNHKTNDLLASKK